VNISVRIASPNHFNNFSGKAKDLQKAYKIYKCIILRNSRIGLRRNKNWAFTIWDTWTTSTLAVGLSLAHQESTSVPKSAKASRGEQSSSASPEG